ncbi:MAG TPA: helix-turn-helix domain-containing protein [Rhizomicrobium sp.]|jgi:DNA-binding transcriptional ArsR family regulator|nr:helix-turn-helix domain-containing protein [Rhizomicrobium sp.]
MPKKHVLSPSQLESLTSPVRLAIVQRLEIGREVTAREIAQRVGRPVTALYHHLKQLEDAGLVRVVGERKGPRRPEAVYALIADQLSSAEVVKTKSGRKILGRAATRVTDAGARAFSRAMTKMDPQFDGSQRNAMVRFFVLRANKTKLAQLNRIIDELHAAACEPSEDGQEIHLIWLLAPMAGKP